MRKLGEDLLRALWFTLCFVCVRLVPWVRPLGPLRWLGMTARGSGCKASCVRHVFVSGDELNPRERDAGSNEGLPVAQGLSVTAKGHWHLCVTFINFVRQVCPGGAGLILVNFRGY